VLTLNLQTRWDWPCHWATSARESGIHWQLCQGNSSHVQVRSS